MACLDIKWNSCACFLTTRNKQDILCKIPYKHRCDFQEIKTDALTQYKASKSEHLTEFKEHVFVCRFLVRNKKNKKSKKVLHMSVSCVVFILCFFILRTMCKSITLPAS